MQAVLGVKMFGHDTGAALIYNDKVIAIAEERLNRIKYSPDIFPTLSIQYCLDAAGITESDVELVVGEKTPEQRSLEDQTKHFHEQSKGRFSHARYVTAGHHDAHAASAFFCSPFEESAILIYDGAGDEERNHLGISVVETETLYYGSGTSLSVIDKTVHVPSSALHAPYTAGIGTVYATLSRDYLNFGYYNEGKMMGLAAYGNDSFLKQFPFERWVTTHNGQLVCNGQILFSRGGMATQKDFRTLLNTLYWGVRLRILRLVGSLTSALRRKKQPHIVANPHLFEEIRIARPMRDKIDPLPETYYASVAYAAQKVFERFAIEIGNHLKAITRSKNLCVAGGCGLNIDANRNFITEVGFESIFVQPASSDCGLGLGYALWGYHMVLGKPRFWEMKNASLGRSYSQGEVDAAITVRHNEIQTYVAKDVAKEAAHLIASGKIIGWFQGGAEYGPRALGNRSILCDPRDPKMKDTLNARVKHREMWRPFATSILREKLTEWFDIDTDSPATAFMLLAALVRKEKQPQIPSLVHVDETCRMQTLTKEANGKYYDLVKAFEDETGVPMILNTSFNLGGDPIVESPKDALDTFLRTDLDYLILENKIVSKA